MHILQTCQMSRPWSDSSTETIFAGVSERVDACCSSIHFKGVHNLHQSHFSITCYLGLLGIMTNDCSADS